MGNFLKVEKVHLLRGRPKVKHVGNKLKHFTLDQSLDIKISYVRIVKRRAILGSIVWKRERTSSVRGLLVFFFVHSMMIILLALESHANTHYGWKNGQDKIFIAIRASVAMHSNHHHLLWSTRSTHYGMSTLHAPYIHPCLRYISSIRP